jgi:predicted phosphodiesterase
MGEVVSLSAMGGRNSYNMKVACARLERYFQSVVKLGTEHWTGPPPDSIYLVLGGDLVSGEIHDELAKTNDLQAIPAVRVLAEALAAGLLLLRENFPAIPIHVISVPGNHGRTTKKPENKGFAINSYDMLVGLLLEWWAATKELKGVTFSAPHAGDAFVTIHGWNILFTHGDRIGSRGGSGFVGPAATAARGMQKVVQDYLAEGRVIDVIVMGHFHTPLELEYGIVNPSLVGPSEYSRSGRMRSHPAAQWMLTVHPRYGIARRWKISVGDPSEGSIYAGRAA